MGQGTSSHIDRQKHGLILAEAEENKDSSTRDMHVQEIDFKTLYSVYIAVFIDTLGLGLTIPVFSYFILDIGGSTTEIGLILSTCSICQVLGNFVMGTLSDKLGRRGIFLFTILASAISFILCAFCTTIWQVLLVRGIPGLAGSCLPIAQAIVSDMVNDESKKVKYIGLLGACLGVAVTLGAGLGAAIPALSIALGIPASWKYSVAFIFAFVLNMIAFVYSAIVLKEPVKDEEDPVSEDSAINSSAKIPWQVYAIGSCCLCFQWGFTTMQSTYAVLINQLWDWSAAGLGIVLSIAGVEIAICQGLIIKPMVSKLGTRKVCIVSGLLLSSGIGFLPVLPEFPLHFLMFALMTAGYSIGSTVTAIMTTQIAPKSVQGKALGTVAGFQSIAQAATPLTAGYLFDNLGSEYAYGVGGIIGIFASIIPLLIPSCEASAQKDVFNSSHISGNVVSEKGDFEPIEHIM